MNPFKEHAHRIRVFVLLDGKAGAFNSARREAPVATVEEVRRDVGAWLSEQLGHTVESEEDFDHEEVTFKVLWTDPLQLIFLPRLVSDGRTTAEIIGLLERQRVPETLKSGEHSRGRLTPHGLHWVS